MQGQFEQQLNAHMLATLNYGAQANAPNYSDIAAFLYDLPKYEHALKSYPRQGNRAITDKLDALLANHCAQLQALQTNKH